MLHKYHLKLKKPSIYRNNADFIEIYKYYLVQSNNFFIRSTKTKGNKMLNKLRLSTAIVGSLAGLGLSAAVAQTTVSGNVNIGFIATSTDNTIKDGSWSSMTKETQINLATKGKLNNGMDYAAGFSIENDGGDTGATGTHAEGNYIEISSGATTLTLGADRIQNGDAHFTNAVGVGYIGQDGLGDGALGTASASSTSIFPKHGSIYQFFGVGAVQTVGKGKLSAYYVPNMSTTLLNDIGNDATASTANNTSAGRKGSAYEIGYRGDLGVSGLQAKAFMTSGDRVDMKVSANKKVKTRNLGLAYTTGAVTLSAEKITTEGVQGGYVNTSTALTEELSGKAVGIAYAASKDLSLGLTYAKADSNHATSVETEKTVIASIGYSLGAVAVKASYADVSDFQGVAGNDGKQFRLLMLTNF